MAVRRALGAAQRLGELVAAALLFVMMAVTFLDVLGRYVLNRPLPGSAETTQYLLVLMIFVALPVVTARGGHISISLVDGLFDSRANALRMAFVDVLAGTTMAVMAWFLWRYAQMLALHRDVIGYLLVPVAPAAYAAAVLSAVTAVAFLGKALVEAGQWRSRRPAS
ncbi:MAG: TRAP transporter small permease [Betaproteobacteria bacterium]